MVSVIKREEQYEKIVDFSWNIVVFISSLSLVYRAVCRDEWDGDLFFIIFCNKSPLFYCGGLALRYESERALVASPCFGWNLTFVQLGFI